jgi:hypothetical protein
MRAGFLHFINFLALSIARSNTLSASSALTWIYVFLYLNTYDVDVMCSMSPSACGTTGFDTMHVAKEASKADPSKLLIDVIISRISEDVTESNIEKLEDFGS